MACPVDRQVERKTPIQQVQGEALGWAAEADPKEAGPGRGREILARQKGVPGAVHNTVSAVIKFFGSST